MSDLGAAERAKLAKRFDRHALHLVLAAVLMASIALIDLSTSSPIDDRRTDIGLLAAAVLGISSSYSLRRLAKRFRTNDLSKPQTTWTGVVRAVASTAASMALVGGIGYLMGGWVFAAIVTPATIILMAAAVTVAIHRRRRVTEP